MGEVGRRGDKRRRGGRGGVWRSTGLWHRSPRPVMNQHGILDVDPTRHTFSEGAVLELLPQVSVSEGSASNEGQVQPRGSPASSLAPVFHKFSTLSVF